MTAPDDPADELYGLPAERFVAERDALAKTLRAEGDRAGADAVKKLPKPTQAAAAINLAVREHAEAAGALREAAGLLEAAQEELLAGGGARALREAGDASRAAVDTLVALTTPPGQAGADKVRATLQAATVDAEILAEVVAGRVVRDHVASSFGGLAGMGAGAARTAKQPAGAGPAANANAKTTKANAPAGAGRAVEAKTTKAKAKAGSAAKAKATKSTTPRDAGPAAEATNAKAVAAKVARAKEAEAEAKAAAREAAQRKADEERVRATTARDEARRRDKLRRAKEAEAKVENEVLAARRALEQMEAALGPRRRQLREAEARLADATRRRERAED